MAWLLAAGVAGLGLAAVLGLAAAPGGRRLLGRHWPGRLPKTKARAAFRRLRLFRDLAALLGVSCAMAAVAAAPRIAALGLALALLLAAARFATR